jgi:hypothetical protein
MNMTDKRHAVTVVLWLSVLSLVLWASAGFAADAVVSGPFQGAKANKGTVTYHHEGNKRMLTLSDDFVIPDTPDPHWRLMDASGNAYLLQKYKIKDDKYNKTIEIPSYVKDVAKVQSWCAWAETVLGEAAFKKPVK